MASILDNINYLSMMTPSQATEAELKAGSAPTTPVRAPGWTLAAQGMLSIDLASDSEDSHGISGYHCLQTLQYDKIISSIESLR